MKIAEQIEMVKIMRKSFAGEAKVWQRMKHDDTAYSCREQAKACAAVLGSLKRLKTLVDYVERARR